MPEPHSISPTGRLLSEGAARVVELAREVLRERGLSEDEIDAELAKPAATPGGAQLRAQRQSRAI